MFYFALMKTIKTVEKRSINSTLLYKFDRVALMQVPI